MSASFSPPAPLDVVGHGLVVAFDYDAGLGVLHADGGDEVGFHCTAIADGTRTIGVGAPVNFTLGLAHLGGVEARNIHPG